MNINVIKKDDNKYVVTNEKGKMKVVSCKEKDKTVSKIIDILLRENTLDEIQMEIEKYENNLRDFKEYSYMAINTFLTIMTVLLSIIICSLLLINFVSLPLVMIGALISMFGLSSYSFLRIKKHGTFFSGKRKINEINTKINILRENYQELNKKLDIIKNNLGYTENDSDELEWSQYSYKWNINDNNTNKQSEVKVLRLVK